MLIILLIKYVSACLRVAVLLREAEVDHVEARFGWLPGRHDEVGRLNIAMYEPARVNILNTSELRGGASVQCATCK